MLAKLEGPPSCLLYILGKAGHQSVSSQEMLGKLVTRASGARECWESWSPEHQEPGDAELLNRETWSFGDLILMDRPVYLEKLTKN